MKAQIEGSQYGLDNAFGSGADKQKYFKVHQSVEENFKLELNEELNKEQIHSENKGSKGMVYMAISALCYTFMAFFLKVLYLNSDVNTYEFTYWSSMIMGLFNFSLFKSAGRDHLLVRDDLRVTLIVRSVCAFLGATGFYLALQYTDLSKATALYWTNPMMTAVIAYFALNETLAFIDWLAILVSFAGILVIQNPWAHDVAPSFEDFHGTMAALGGALFIAIAQMQTRQLRKRVHFLVVPFYQAIFSAFIAPLLMIIFLRYRTAHTTHYGWLEAFLILIISILQFAA